MTQPKNISIRIATPKGLSKACNAVIYGKAIELQEQLDMPVFIDKEYDSISSSEILNIIERATLRKKQVEYRDANNQ